MKKDIRVSKAFVLTLPTGEKHVFPAGKHEVDDKLADHWYVKAHLEQDAPEAEKAGKTNKK